MCWKEYVSRMFPGRADWFFVEYPAVLLGYGGIFMIWKHILGCCQTFFRRQWSALLKWIVHGRLAHTNLNWRKMFLYGSVVRNLNVVTHTMNLWKAGGASGQLCWTFRELFIYFCKARWDQRSREYALGNAAPSVLCLHVETRAFPSPRFLPSFPDPYCSSASFCSFLTLNHNPSYIHENKHKYVPFKK